MMACSPLLKTVKRANKLVRHLTPQAENPRKNHVKSCFSSFFQWNFGQNPFQNLRKTRPIILNRSQPPSTTPSPFYIDFTSLIFFWKQHVIFSKFFELFPICSLFSELWRLWDHSQIVDLIFLIWMVSTRASESSKTPHSWQNNVPNFIAIFFTIR